MSLGKKLPIKAAYTTIMLFLIFFVCTFENIPALSTFSVTGACDAPVFGPSSDELEHTEDTSISLHFADITVKDFIVEATFYNPYSTTEGKWDYGFLFRFDDENTLYAIPITSDGTWRHLVRIGEDWETIDQGVVDLRTEAKESNHLRIIVIGNSGAFYVNGQFVYSLDTSGLTESGDICVATGINPNYKIPGKTTRYKDFTAWSLDERTFGPSSGDLKDKKDGSVEFSSANVNMKDFIVEATFYNPYSPTEGKWDYGFLFRSIEEGTSYAILVTSEGTWSHAVKIGGDWNIIGQGAIDLRTKANQNNRLRVIVIGDSGWFYIDDQFVATLGTTRLRESGDISVATGIITENEIENGATRFERFTIWSLDGCPKLSKYESPDKDSDSDGVIDDNDDCYNPECTIVDENGCPEDSDSDGVSDCEDECPSQKGSESSNGCPLDSDKDGVLEDTDDCYNPECTIVDENGCPKDSDSDGVRDCEDNCPSEYGEAEYDGCPLDTDKDGVPDRQDSCDNPGCDIVDENGCPKDSDSDGVRDCEDNCPSQEGPATNNGCPSSYMYAIPVIIAITIAIIVISIIIQKKRKGQKEKVEEKITKEKPKKTICPFCKNEVEEDWVSCPYCGIKIKEDTQAYSTSD